MSLIHHGSAWNRVQNEGRTSESVCSGNQAGPIRNGLKKPFESPFKHFQNACIFLEDDRIFAHFVLFPLNVQQDYKPTNHSILMKLVPDESQEPKLSFAYGYDWFNWVIT